MPFVVCRSVLKLLSIGGGRLILLILPFPFDFLYGLWKSWDPYPVFQSVRSGSGFILNTVNCFSKRQIRFFFVVVFGRSIDTDPNIWIGFSFWKLGSRSGFSMCGIRIWLNSERSDKVFFLLGKSGSGFFLRSVYPPPSPPSSLHSPPSPSPPSSFRMIFAHDLSQAPSHPGPRIKKSKKEISCKN